ncbi:MAG: hypothetical protein JWQ33_701 [Ramlibacter sp.]|nr:hypothetical protein [Ramlibacter sp.]
MNRLRFELAMKSHRRRRARARGPELKPRAWLRLNAARRDAGETAHADLKLRDCLNGLKAPCSSFASR